MKQVIIHNLDRSIDTPLRARVCKSFLCKLRGLTFRRKIPLDLGLLLVQDRDSRMDASIHMLGVFFDLWVVWINSQGRVVDERLARRWRPVYIPQKPARYVLEMSPLRNRDYHVGDKVHFEKVLVD
jgi:uncharacterized membrane protein (UPF0127 family)